MVKDGKASKEMRERRDTLELALQVAGITNSNVVEMLDGLISLFKYPKKAANFAALKDVLQ